MQRIRGVKRGTFYFITVLEIAFCCLLDAGNCRVFGVALRHPMGGSSECRNRSGGLHERVPWNSAATRQGDPKQKMLFVTVMLSGAHAAKVRRLAINCVESLLDRSWQQMSLFDCSER
jgi:hypothetical protein